mgnify:CR=1 FL=1
MRLKLLHIIGFICLCFGGFSSCAAQNPQSIDAATTEFLTYLEGNPRLINSPAPTNWKIGGKNRDITDVKNAALPGGQGLRIKITQQGENGYDVTAAMPITKPIADGDVLLVAYYARGEQAFNEANTAIITSSQIELTRAPYTAAGRSAARLGSEWTIYYLSGKAARDYAVGDAQISLHLAGSRQTLDLGPAFVFNFGPDMDINALPRDRITYDGRKDDAPWRAQAAARIETHRKGDLVISVVDASGVPVQNAKIDVNMRKHAYGFGTFTNHDFVKSDGSKDDTIHKQFGQLFNLATAPVYWADWGWQNPERRADYMATGQYLADQNIPWRAHTIMWPGERYMPQVLVDLDGDPEKQREWVLDHVREVMTFLDPLAPMAIDLTNEPRTNQYFMKRGNPELVSDAFRLAHSIAPDIPLFINDYAILNGGGVNTGNIEFYKN